jgi:PAS domain S-box-containing protein
MRLGVRRKLLGAFGLVVVLTAVVGWVALDAGRTAGDRGRAIYDEDVTGMARLARLAPDAYRVRQLALLHTIAVDQAQLDGIEAEIEALDARIEAYVAIASAAHVSPEARAALAELRTAWREYVIARDTTTLALSRAGSKEAARSAAAGSVGRSFAEVERALARLTARSVAAAEQRIDETDNALARNEAVVLGLVLGTLAAGLVLALLVAHPIARGIQRVAGTAERLSLGDLGQRSGVRSGDEIGMLGESFDRMAERLEARDRYRAALGKLSALALANGSFAALVDDIAAVVARTLGADHAEILELDSRGGAVVLAASPGGAEGLRADAGPGSQTGFVVACSAPVVVADLAADERFTASQHLLDRGLASGVACVVDRKRPFGILQAFTVAPRVFTTDEASFLASVADVVATTLRRVRAEEALRESEERFRTIFESAPIGITVLDRDGRPVEANRAFEEMLGYTEEELLGYPLADHEHPDDESEELWSELVSGRRDQVVAERRYVRKDGSTLWGRLTTCLVRDDRGDPEFGLTLVEDVTERELLEEQLRQAQRLEAIGRLAGGVAHDFNNLLTVVAGYCELALGRVSPDEALHDDLVEIRRAAERATALTRQLLAFGRRQILQPKVIDLNAVVAEMEAMLRRLIGEHVDLYCVLEPGLPAVKADPGQVEQVVANLVVNARDAMAGGGRLTMETAHVYFDADYVRSHAEVEPGEYAMIAITDTGVGMDDETRARIFEPFFTTKERGRGTGLGLATVYGIVRQSGGHIWVYSEPGRGTTFKVYLPVASDEPHGETIAADEVAKETRLARILLVEDDEHVRELVRAALVQCGHDVVVASEPGEALAFLGGPEQVDLVLTDVVLPKMSGRELADRLAALRPGISVLFMSGWTENAIVHHGVLDPGTPFLQKPFTPESLCRKVREVLQGPESA